MRKTKIAFLFDDKNDWISKYIVGCKKIESNSSKYSFKYYFSTKGVTPNDVIFILGYTKILNEDFLSKNKLNLVVHESALPKGKGFSPVQWQILEGKNTITVSLIEAICDLDAGDILFTSKIELDGYELFGEIRKKQADATISLITAFLQKYPDYNRKEQVGKETIYHRRRENDDQLDPDKTIREQFNHFRIANNDDYPLFFKIDGHKYFLKIHKSR